MATAYRPKALEYEADSPRGLAWRMASYQKDPNYIRAMVLRDYGRSPTVGVIEGMIAAHKRTREAFANDHITAGAHYNPENDNGEAWRPRGLVKPPVLPVGNKVDTEKARGLGCGPTTRAVNEAVAEVFGIDPGEITGPSRNSYVVSARFVALRLLSEIKKEDGTPRFSTCHLGHLFGGRCGSTIRHALGTFNDRARAYPEMMEAYDALRGCA